MMNKIVCTRVVYKIVIITFNKLDDKKMVVNCELKEKKRGDGELVMIIHLLSTPLGEYPRIRAGFVSQIF